MDPQPNRSGEHAEVRPTLLIADDDPVIVSTLSAQLEAEFDVVAIARSATEAVALADTHRPDVALIDVQMPDGGAREVVPRIAGCSPGTCMVILSADESRDSVLELLTAGASAYLRKGVPGREIAQALRDALEARAGHVPV
jgi:DNA-binding NarL/FixJ family response regulator